MADIEAKENSERPAVAPEPQPEPGYLPPIAVILKGLGLAALPAHAETVSVDGAFLRFLIGEILRATPFDRRFYALQYPDVEAARLAGDVPSLHEHFLRQGYFEGRLPHAFPFDARWYHDHYRDLAQVYPPDDIEELRHHFYTKGWQEGRVGISALETAAGRWLAAVAP
ncbi:MAG: hypothetical protein JO209_02785 [Acidisphaera sp.]|nr:hypothetical protein [Acidisphaera sp.]